MMNDRIEHTEHRRAAAPAEQPVAWAGPGAAAVPNAPAPAQQDPARR